MMDRISQQDADRIALILTRNYSDNEIITILGEKNKSHAFMEIETAAKGQDIYQSLSKNERADMFQLLLKDQGDTISRKSKNSNIPIVYFRFPSMKSIYDNDDPKENWNRLAKNFPIKLFSQFLSYSFGSKRKGVYLVQRLLYKLGKDAVLKGLEDLGYNSIYQLNPEETKSLEIFANITQKQRLKINQFSES